MIIIQYSPPIQHFTPIDEDFDRTVPTILDRSLEYLIDRWDRMIIWAQTALVSIFWFLGIVVIVGLLLILVALDLFFSIGGSS